MMQASKCEISHKRTFWSNLLCQTLFSRPWLLRISTAQFTMWSGYMADWEPQRTELAMMQASKGKISQKNSHRQIYHVRWLQSRLRLSKWEFQNFYCNNGASHDASHTYTQSHTHTHTVTVTLTHTHTHTHSHTHSHSHSHSNNMAIE